MKIPCINCSSIFQLDNSHINPTGSLVRCSNCRFIFIVHPQDFTGQPKIQDTNIDQSILDDLFGMEQAARTQLPLDEISKEWRNLFERGVLTIKDFDEEVVEESDSSIVDNECTGLPDLSEYENMIDWESNEDSEEPPAS